MLEEDATLDRNELEDVLGRTEEVVGEVDEIVETTLEEPRPDEVELAILDAIELVVKLEV